MVKSYLTVSKWLIAGLEPRLLGRQEGVTTCIFACVPTDGCWPPLCSELLFCSVSGFFKGCLWPEMTVLSSQIFDFVTFNGTTICFVVNGRGAFSTKPLFLACGSTGSWYHFSEVWFEHCLILVKVSFESSFLCFSIADLSFDESSFSVFSWFA